ncbi:unnamed protein product [Closterium sp. NIES-65]|nr:unnamed protein product [Closterium sp. NIES-65]
MGVLSRREPLSPPKLREWFARRWSCAVGAGGHAATGAARGTGAARPGGARTGGTGAAGAGGVVGVGAGVAGAVPAGGAAGAGASGTAGVEAGGAGAVPTGGAASAGASSGAGVGAGGTGAVPAGGAAGAGASGAARVGAGDSGAGPAGGAAGAGASGAAGVGAGDSGAGGLGAVSASSGSAARPRPYFVPLLQQVLGLPPSTGTTPPLLCATPDQSQSQLPRASPLPGPSPYTGPTGGLAERHEPASRPASPVRSARTSRRVPRPRPPPDPGTHQMALRPSSVPLRIPLPSPPASSLADGPDPEFDPLRVASPIVTRLLATVVTGPSFESTAPSALVAELVDFAARCRLDCVASLVTERPGCTRHPDPALLGRGNRGSLLLSVAVNHGRRDGILEVHRHFCNDVPPPGANIVRSMWIFRVKRPPGSPPFFKARYVARGFSQRHRVDFFHTFSPTLKMTTLRVLLHVTAQRDYELHTLDFSTSYRAA